MPPKSNVLQFQSTPIHLRTRDTPDRFAPSPALNPDDQFELIQEITEELRILESEFKSSHRNSKNVIIDGACFSVPMLSALTRLKGAQRRALLGLEYLRRETANENESRNRSRVRVGTYSYEFASFSAKAIKAKVIDVVGSYGFESVDLESFVQQLKSQGAEESTVDFGAERKLILEWLEYDAEERKRLLTERNILEHELEEEMEIEEGVGKSFWKVVCDALNKVKHSCDNFDKEFALCAAQN